MILLISRPSLKGRTISCDSRKVTVVKPINHGLLLLYAGVPLPIIRAQLMRPQRQPVPLFLALLVVCPDKSTPYEK